MDKPSQVIVKLFSVKHNIKFIGNKFAIQAGIANSLLKDYQLEDILLVIEYTALFPKQRIHSLAYFKYIMDDTIPKAKAWKIREEERYKVSEYVAEKMEVQNKSLSNKKLFKRGVF